MVTVGYNDQTDRYEVVSRGTIKSRHTSADAAKRAGKRLGKQMGEPVSYQGPRMNSAKWIFRPSAEEQFGNGGGSGGGGLFGF